MKNVDNTGMERMRQTVVEQELSARSWRAMREKMEDTIAIHHLEEEYNKVIEYNNTKLAEQQEAMKTAMAEMAKMAEEKNLEMEAVS